MISIFPKERSFATSLSWFLEINASVSYKEYINRNRMIHTETSELNIFLNKEMSIHLLTTSTLQL